MVRSEIGTTSEVPGSAQYETAKAALEQALRLGIEVESNDPTLSAAVPALTPAQVSWVAAWLAGEGFDRVRR